MSGFWRSLTSHSWRSLTSHVWLPIMFLFPLRDSWICSQEAHEGSPWLPKYHATAHLCLALCSSADNEIYHFKIPSTLSPYATRFQLTSSSAILTWCHAHDIRLFAPHSRTVGAIHNPLFGLVSNQRIFPSFAELVLLLNADPTATITFAMTTGFCS